MVPVENRLLLTESVLDNFINSCLLVEFECIKEFSKTTYSSTCLINECYSIPVGRRVIAGQRKGAILNSVCRWKLNYSQYRESLDS